jgi:glutathione S-transferase
MLELFQHEGSSDCGRVRRRLSELMIDYIARQVPQDPALRTRLQLATGQSDVPVIIDPEQRMIVTEADDIIAYLEETYGARQTAP